MSSIPQNYKEVFRADKPTYLHSMVGIADLVFSWFWLILRGRNTEGGRASGRKSGRGKSVDLGGFR